MEAEDKGGILAGAITETERIVREDRELLDRLGLDADDFQLTDVLKGVRVIENCTRSHMRERCQYDHASGIMLVSSNATQLDICRALVSALICKSLEARIDTPEMIWIRKGMEALPTESTSLQMRQIVKHATEIADELRDRRGGDRLGRLDSSWKHNGAAMVYEYLLRRHPERVEALISRVVKNIGTERQRGVRRAFNRIILPFFNVVSWPMTRLAGFVLEHILPSPTNRLHPRQRNLLTSGARGRRSRRLQDEVVQRDILTFVRNSMGVGEA